MNAPSSCCYLSKFYCRKEAWAMQKLFIKKEEKRERRKKKMTQKCPRYLKQWVLRCPPEKKREEKMNKIAPKIFLFLHWE